MVTNQGAQIFRLNRYPKIYLIYPKLPVESKTRGGVVRARFD